MRQDLEDLDHEKPGLDPNKRGVWVTCIKCGRRKKPYGRSAPAEMAGGLCDISCGGYYDQPFAGNLWPGESEVEFGYPA